MDKFNEKNIALTISANLEYTLKTKKIKANELADFLEVSKQSVSINRQILKKGKLPNSRFLVGVSIFLNENFLKNLHV